MRVAFRIVALFDLSSYYSYAVIKRTLFSINVGSAVQSAGRRILMINARGIVINYVFANKCYVSATDKQKGTEE